MPRFPFPLRWPLLAAALLTSCRPPERVEVQNSREAFRNEPEPPLGLTDKHRFAANTAQSFFAWKTPEGWREVAATQFRHINFTFGPANEGECYVSIVDGGGGNDVLDNINRWRAQMGQPPVKNEDLASIPTKKVMGSDAPTIDLVGTYSAGGPMSEPSAPRPAWRLVGTIYTGLPPALGVCTVKMTGPEDLVEKNMAAYETLLTSLGTDPMLRELMLR